MSNSKSDETAIAATLSGGQAMVRFQDDVMMGIAVQRQRVISVVREELLAELIEDHILG